MFRKYLLEADKTKLISATYSEMKNMSYEGLCAVAEKMNMSCGEMGDQKKQLQAMYKEMKDMDEKMLNAMRGVKEDASNDKSDDGEGLDKVDPKAAKKKFADRKDKDLDNDGDTDSSDEYLHKRRKAITKALGEATSKQRALASVKAQPKSKVSLAKAPWDKKKGKNEEAEQIEEATKKFTQSPISNLSDEKLKYHAEKKFPHGRFTPSEIKQEHKRRKKSDPDYRAVKPSLNLPRWAQAKEENQIDDPRATALDEAPRRKRPAKIKHMVDPLKVEREKNRAHDSAMGRTKTGRKKPVSRTTSTQRSMASMRNEAKEDYTISHKSFSSAVQHALAQVEKRGFTVDEEEWGRKVAMGPRKPGKGKTNSYSIDLMKDDKETRKKLQMQVYYDEGRYELNMYVS